MTFDKTTQGDAMNIADLSRRVAAALAPAARKPTAAESRYSELIAELHRSRERAAERKEVAADLNEVSGFIRHLEEQRHGLDGWEPLARIEDATAEREVRRAALSAQIAEASAERDTLNARLAEIPAPESILVTGETLAQHSACLRQLAAEVADLEARRAEIAAATDPTPEERDELRQIGELRDEIAAAEALGLVDAAKLDEIRAPLIEAEARQRERAESRRRAAEALAGVDRRIQAAHEALTGTEALTKALVVAWAGGELSATAEHFQREAEKARTHLLRCRALHEIVRRNGGNAPVPTADVLAGVPVAPLLDQARTEEEARLEGFGIAS